jgi:hypothetical protein
LYPSFTAALKSSREPSDYQPNGSALPFQADATLFGLAIPILTPDIAAAATCHKINVGVFKN